MNETVQGKITRNKNNAIMGWQKFMNESCEEDTA